MEMWRRGFFAESATIYDLPRNDPSEYLSDYQHFVRCGRINAWDGFYTHKLGLRSLLLAMGFQQAETAAYIHERRILASPFSESARYVSLEELLTQLAAGTGPSHYIVKPEDGWCGEDIFLLTFRDGQFTRRRGQNQEPFDFDSYMGALEERADRERRDVSGVLIEGRLEQGAFWRGLFPDSANTLRLLTLWTPGDPQPFVARAVQRIGTADTVPTDNWSGGGISAPVDLASGTLGEGRMHPLKGKRAQQRFTHHPDTGARIAGAVLPGWDRVMDTVLRAAASVPFNRMAGWDILVDAEGVPVILEANGNSDVNLLQVHGGLLAEPRIRRFYAAFGVLGQNGNGSSRAVASAPIDRSA
jgi:Sugar-transfer associated ATP-grasp